MEHFHLKSKPKYFRYVSQTFNLNPTCPRLTFRPKDILFCLTFRPKKYLSFDGEKPNGQHILLTAYPILEQTETRWGMHVFTNFQFILYLTVN